MKDSITAKELKETLWKCLNDLNKENPDYQKAITIASVTRAILKAVRTQLIVASHEKKTLPKDLVDFNG